MLWKNSILPLFKTFDLFVLFIAELVCFLFIFLKKVFSKIIDHKLELILTLCFHSHLNPSLNQEDTGKLTLEAWNKLQKKPVQPLSQKDRP